MSEDKPNLKELLIYITQIEDKRQISKIKHKLNDIVVITLFAMLANIEYWEEIEEFAKMYFKTLKDTWNYQTAYLRMIRFRELWLQQSLK